MISVEFEVKSKKWLNLLSGFKQINKCFYFTIQSIENELYHPCKQHLVSYIQYFQLEISFLCTPVSFFISFFFWANQEIWLVLYDCVHFHLCCFLSFIRLENNGDSPLYKLLIYSCRYGDEDNVTFDVFPFRCKLIQKHFPFNRYILNRCCVGGQMETNACWLDAIKSLMVNNMS